MQGHLSGNRDGGADALQTGGVNAQPCGHVGVRRLTDSRSRHVALFGGLAAVAAGGCWVAKAGGILAAGLQPPILFELAPLLMAVAVLALAWQLPPSARRTTSVGLAVLAAAAATPVLLDELAPLPHLVTGAGMAAANLLVLIGLALVGGHLHAVLPLLLAVITVPAVIAGGLLMMLLGERALEIPILVLGAVWAALGVSMIQGRHRAA